MNGTYVKSKFKKFIFLYSNEEGSADNYGISRSLLQKKRGRSMKRFYNKFRCRVHRELYSFSLLIIVYVPFISKEWQNCEHDVKNFYLFLFTQKPGFTGNFIKFKEFCHKLFILTYYINLIDFRYFGEFK